MPDIAERRKISNDTVARSEQITTSTPGASLESSFITASTYASLSPLDPEFPNLQLRAIEVQDLDSFLSARQLIANDTGLKDKIAVLNLASDEEPGGGWRYSLRQGSIAGIFSPNVVVFKDTLDNNCVELKQEERVVISVLTVAAPRCPELTADGENFKEESVLQEFREKVRLVLRCAAREGKTGLVLGAMGCGAYRCPPRLVAREMKEVLGEEEFKGWFGKVVFAVYGRGPVGKRNLEVFKDVFDNE
ncbi:hypothetical protein E4T43_06641 [Aureobasidium subglaciale]|nr:hypothetical protein E4T43_06641 [Aureobasidium subglaciale]